MKRPTATAGQATTSRPTHKPTATPTSHHKPTKPNKQVITLVKQEEATAGHTATYKEIKKNLAKPLTSNYSSAILHLINKLINGN